MKKLLLLVITGVMYCLGIHPIFAAFDGNYDSKKDSSKHLIIQTMDGSRSFPVKKEEKIKIWLKGEPVFEAMGFFEVVDDQTIRINAKEYAISDISKIKVRTKGLTIAGSVSLIASAIAFILIAPISSASSTGYEGYPLFALGFLFLVFGIFLRQLGWNKWRLGNKWKLHIK